MPCRQRKRPRNICSEVLRSEHSRNLLMNHANNDFAVTVERKWLASHLLQPIESERAKKIAKFQMREDILVGPVQRMEIEERWSNFKKVPRYHDRATIHLPRFAILRRAAHWRDEIHKIVGDPSISYGNFIIRQRKRQTTFGLIPLQNYKDKKYGSTSRLRSIRRHSAIFYNPRN